MKKPINQHLHSEFAPQRELCSLRVLAFALLAFSALSVSVHFYWSSSHLAGFHHPSLHLSAQVAHKVQSTATAGTLGDDHIQLLSDVPGYSGPPYILPKFIHQSVLDKTNISCEVQDSIQSWIDMNPGYTHILYENADWPAFVRMHYPDLLPVFQALPSEIERADMWRYLALHKLGGVYADSDVKCMEPISTWNQIHNFDAAMMVGIAKRNMRTGDTREFNQFLMATMPGHPVMAAMPMIIAANLAHSFLTDSISKASGMAADQQVLMRTGPKAFTSALHAYAQRVGATWPINSTQADEEGGVLFGSVRAMPKFVLGAGWDTIEHNMTCEEVKAQVRPEALICHRFLGAWKARPEKELQSRTLTYGDCHRRQQLQEPGVFQQQQRL